MAIVFGLAFSKLITLGLVPSMLALPYRWRERRAARRARTGGAPPPPPIGRYIGEWTQEKEAAE